jgi:bacteriocin biosynthesis cyclodehydratase domain-containing protein
VRPVLKPGLRRLWRDGSTLQFGIDPSRAVVVPGVTPAQVAALDALDGSRTRARLLADADPAACALLAQLDDAGLLDDAAPGHDDAPSDERERMSPDLAALALQTREPGAAHRRLARRARARVRVVGAGRVGAHCATLLAAAGIGHVVVDDPGVTRPADVSPGGPALADVGRPRAVAAAAALRRVSRGRVPTGAAEPFSPDLVVLTPLGPPVIRWEDALALGRHGEPHLLAGVRETTGVVGPLVVPGRTGCLHCQHLSRYARDPAWPLLALQLARQSESGPDPCEVTLAALVAALTAAQALAFVDVGGRHAPDAALPPTVDGTLELPAPDWRIRRRSWLPDPDCPCGAAGRSERTA